MPYAQVAYRSRVPRYTLPDAAGIYYSYVVGRIRIVVTDGRSFMSPIAQADNASKTKLGATQKAWLKQQLADPSCPVTIWCHEDAWVTGPTYVGDDTWGAYTVERQEIADYIASRHLNVLYVHGDLHTLAADTGANSAGGIPVACASPLDNTGFIGGGTYSQGRYPPANSVAPDYYTSYGWFDVTDTRSRIKVVFTGYDSSGTARMSLTVQWRLGGRCTPRTRTTASITAGAAA